jgi:hypothetical protein
VTVAYEKSQAAGVARLIATARQQAGTAQTKLLPRCPSFDPADQAAVLDAEASEMPAPLRWEVFPVLALARLARRLLNSRERS